MSHLYIWITSTLHFHRYRDGCRAEHKSENTLHSELSEEAVTEKEENVEDLLQWSAQLDFEQWVWEHVHRV